VKSKAVKKNLSAANRIEFKVGDVIDCEGFASTVRAVKADTVLIHYNGWKVKWDEWIPKDSDRLSRKKGTASWRNFKVGDVIDCEDAVGKFYESTVRAVKPDEVFIHFNGWADRWDVWIAKDSKRLARKNSHTTGPYA